MTSLVASDWTRALRAVSALMVDPIGLGGMVIRARPGPVRQRIEEALTGLPLAQRRIHPSLDDTQLFGGLNVAASLSAGQLIRDKGLAETSCALILPMAERTPPCLAARLAQLVDTGPGHALVLLDEGADPDEAAPGGLADRLAFFADLSLTPTPQAQVRLPAPADLDGARLLLPLVETPISQSEHLVLLAARFGIDSQRAPLLTLRCARALAALDGSTITTDRHLGEAAELVFASRATQLPETAPDDQPPGDHIPAPKTDPGATNAPSQNGLPDEMLVQAVAACLPSDLLLRLQATGQTRNTGAQGSGAGIKKTGNRRGRPLPSRPGRLDGRARIDVVATLRAAAPWQPMRLAARPDGPQLVIHPSDIRLRRFEDHSDRLVIFAVDASGSAAMARMAEAKGAIELLLGQAYAKRDQVALVAFRGTGAEVLLPPTRSLVQAKRRLSALPGGGGTPLATGLKAAFELAVTSTRAGLSPSLAILTDGRGNIALDGSPGRIQSKSDTQAMAQLLRTLDMPCVVIDTSVRPGVDSTDLASCLGGHYLPLPRADAQRIAAAADTALTR